MGPDKHTPTPWAYDAVRGRVYRADSAAGPTIAWVEAGDAGPERTRADGRLLAQAPALRDALRNLAGHLHGCENASDMQFGLIQMSVAKANAVLAEAEAGAVPDARRHQPTRQGG